MKTEFGTITYYNGEYGFIKPNNEGERDLFFHTSCVEESGRVIVKGMKVEYGEGEPTPKGRNCCWVKLL